MPDHPITLDHLRRHILQVIYHVLPPIVFSEEKMHLQALAEELARRFPHLFQQAKANPEGMRILSQFHSPSNDRFETLHITADAMKLTLPVLVRQASGEDLLDLADYRAVIAAVQPVLFRHFAGRSRMRADIVRHCFFEVDDAVAAELITRRGSLGGLPVVHTALTLHFEDARLRITLNMARGGARTGAVAEAPQATSPGLMASVAVHHTQSQPLGDTEITEALDRADAVWPDYFLAAINGDGG